MLVKPLKFGGWGCLVSIASLDNTKPVSVPPAPPCVPVFQGGNRLKGAKYLVKVTQISGTS